MRRTTQDVWLLPFGLEDGRARRIAGQFKEHDVDWHEDAWPPEHQRQHRQAGDRDVRSEQDPLWK
jgi:hypothetical protein